MVNYWLMKAEAESRIVRGKDVKFSLEDFQACPNSETAWEGVRNYEAKNIMKDKMKLGDKVLFYHSNVKVPGVAALAEISKEGYPDHSAWDPEHSYFDEKTDKDKPRWFMVSVKLTRPLAHLVSLPLLRYLSEQSSNKPPPDLSYLTEEMMSSIAEMPLLRRGRLSIQSVPEKAYEAIVLLGDKGGWESMVDEKGKSVIGKKPTKKKETKAPAGGEGGGKRKRAAKKMKDVEMDEEEGAESELTELTESEEESTQSSKKLKSQASQSQTSTRSRRGRKSGTTE